MKKLFVKRLKRKDVQFEATGRFLSQKNCITSFLRESSCKLSGVSNSYTTCLFSTIEGEKVIPRLY